MPTNPRPLTQSEIEIAFITQLLERRGWSVMVGSITTQHLTLTATRPALPEPRGLERTDQSAL